MTRAEIKAALGLRSDWEVETWTRQYRSEGIEASSKPIGRPQKREESEQAELERVRMENALRQFKTPTFEQVREIIDDYVCFFNYERIQLKTRQTPYERRCLSI